MNEPILPVVFFRSESGREPVRDFLKGLTVEDRKAVGADIKTVQFGWPIGMPVVRKMAAELWEVRSDIADGIVRVLFTVHEGCMVLLHGFVKKAQKTPDTDLKTAMTRLRTLKAGGSRSPRAS